MFSLSPGCIDNDQQAVYGEKLISVEGPPSEDGTTSKIEYRVWNPFRSKLAAAILGGVDGIHILPGAKVTRKANSACDAISVKFPRTRPFGSSHVPRCELPQEHDQIYVLEYVVSVVFELYRRRSTFCVCRDECSQYFMYCASSRAQTSR